MNKRLYILAGTVLVLVVISMGTVAYLQGDFKDLVGQNSTKTTSLVAIQLSDSGVEVTSDAVQVTDEVIQITEAGQYEISGQATAMTVSVAEDVTGDVTINLNNASFSSIDFHSTGTNVVKLAKDSTNVLSGGKTGISATNVTLTGEGDLQITDVSDYGIFTSDDLVVEAGNLNINSAGSGLYTKHETDASHGNLTINGGNMTISVSEKEGTSALYAGNQLTINNGNLTVETAYEACVAKHLTINGGTARLTSSAAGMVARDNLAQAGQGSETDITIKGGTNTVISGTSPILANGNISISGGINTFLTSIAEQSVFNYTGSAELTGGTLITLGTVNLSSASQNFLMTSLIGNIGDTVTITDAAGNEIATILVPVSFSNVTYSSDNLTAGGVYFLSTTSGNYGQATATMEVGFATGY